MPHGVPAKTLRRNVLDLTTSRPSPAKLSVRTNRVRSRTEKKAAKMTRQQEIDKSIDSGTVPARYRNSVPKEYQQYIPFEKR